VDNKKALELFDAYLRRRYPHRRTAASYISDVRQFQQRCMKTWDTVTVQDMDSFVDQMHSAGLKPTTIKRRVAALKVYFDVLADLCDSPNHVNPVRTKRHGVKIGQRLPRDLSDSEVSRLWSVVQSARDQAVIALLLEAGLRVSEAVGLSRQDLTGPSASGAPARLHVCGKGQKERIVYLNHHALATLSAWLAVRPPVVSSAMFLNEHKQPITANGVEWVLNQYGTQLDLHLTPHRLRHTFARRVTEAGMPVESLARLMGHAQISTTQIYLAGADPALREQFDQAMQRLAAPDALPHAAPPAVGRDPASSPGRAPVYAQPPDGADWALDLPDAIRQDCLAYMRRHLSGWRPHQRRNRAIHVLGDFARFFRFALARRTFVVISDLRREDIQAYSDALAKRGVQPKAVKGALDRLMGLLHELQEQGQPIAPGVFRVERPKLPDPLPRAVDEAAIRKLEAHACRWLTEDTSESTFAAAWFLTMAHGGLRACEVLDVQRCDVDLAAKRLMVRAGKGDRDRVVYLTPLAVHAMERYLTLYPHPEHAVLFMHPAGRPLSYAYLYQHVRSMGDALGISGLSPHRLRHTFATRLINAGMPITSLQKVLGHDHLSTTQIYARVYDATVERDFRRAMAQVEQPMPLALSPTLFCSTAGADERSNVKVLDNSG
jgi:site-specific recombinase XerD